MRDRAAGQCPAALLGEVLPHRHPLRAVRCGDHLPVSLGGELQGTRDDGLRGDGALHRLRAGGLLLCDQERGVEVGMTMSDNKTSIQPVPEREKPSIVQPPDGFAGSGFFATKLDQVIGLARKNSLWHLRFATSCCGIEFMSVMSSHYDLRR